MWLGLFLLFLFLLLVQFSVRFRLFLEGYDLEAQVELGLGPFFVPVPTRLIERLSRAMRGRDYRTREGWKSTLRLIWRLVDDLPQTIDLLQLKITLGLSDPLTTSLAYAGLWSALGVLSAALEGWGRLKSAPAVIILPDYAAPRLLLSLNCIFHFRVGQIIINELKRVLEISYEE